jgi:hypothetical protein
VPAGWTLTDITCDDTDSSGDTATGVASFEVDPGETVRCVFTNMLIPTDEGCTPGFWQGGFGSQLWNVLSDADWTAAGGVGANPFAHDTLFNSFFTAHTSLDGLTMLDIVGTGGGSAWPQKTARDVVAAYLNASFGLDYPFTAAEIWDMWDDAVTAGTTSAFRSLHVTLDEANNLGCPIGEPIVIITPIGVIPVGAVSLAAIFVGARRVLRRIRGHAA